MRLKNNPAIYKIVIFKTHTTQSTLRYNKKVHSHKAPFGHLSMLPIMCQRGHRTLQSTGSIRGVRYNTRSSWADNQTAAGGRDFLMNFNSIFLQLNCICGHQILQCIFHFHTAKCDIKKYVCQCCLQCCFYTQSSLTATVVLLMGVSIVSRQSKAK